MWKLATVFLLLAFGVYFYLDSLTVPEVPKLPEVNWGPKRDGKGVSNEIRPFRIDVPPSVINDLKQRLKQRRTFVEPLENSMWHYGISTKYLETVLDYWQNKYNWSERQQLLNKYPQFVTNIQGLDIHYYHVRPSNVGKDRNVIVRPLLLLHGWPGSVVEFQKIIPMLVTPRPDSNIVFEVIVPSLPGYGFSDAAVRSGLDPVQMAVVFKNLMQRLGFEKYYIQGGDWGAAIVSNMAVLYPDNVLGVHSNMCSPMMTKKVFTTLVFGSYFPSLIMETEYYSKLYPLKNFMGNLLKESGYFHLQCTKPDTIGAALSSTPEGLAAYILEKFSSWVNMSYQNRPDGGLVEKLTLDELLDNLMVYWVTNSITTSVRLYAEFCNEKSKTLVAEIPVKVPAACALFPNEIAYFPKSILLYKYPNMIQYSHMPRGGHFAAFEEPALLAEDIFSFVNKAEELVKNPPTSTK